MQNYGDKTNNSVTSAPFTVILPLVPPAEGIPAETREAGCLKHEVTVDTAALNYLPPTNQSPYACYCPPIIWQDLKHTYKPATACAGSSIRTVHFSINSPALRLTAFGRNVDSTCSGSCM